MTRLWSNAYKNIRASTFIALVPETSVQVSTQTTAIYVLLKALPFRNLDNIAGERVDGMSMHT